MDRQSAAFREARRSDRVSDRKLSKHLELTHAPLVDPAELKTPDDYEAEQWDSEATGPKTLDEARAALVARIADPKAPDGPEVAGAYEHLPEGGA
jgi:hypothetical protein